MSILSAPTHLASIVTVLLCATTIRTGFALSSADFFKERHGSTGPTSSWPIFEEFASTSYSKQDEPEDIPAQVHGDDSGKSADDLQTGEADFGGGTYNAKKAWKVIDRSRQVTASEVDRMWIFNK